MFGKKIEILILFVLMVFFASGDSTATDANLLPDAAPVSEVNIVPEADTVPDADIISEANAVTEADTIPDVNAAADVNKIAEPVEPPEAAAPPEIDTTIETVAPVRRDELLSPLTARTFYDIGYELYTAKDADFLSARRAIIFFDAVVSLDSRANYVLPDIINIAWRYPDRNFSDAVELSLSEYVDFSSDLEVASKAVGYLLEKVDSREQRQELLMKLLFRFRGKNAMFTSDLSSQLGFLMAETGDAVNAQVYLARAFAANKYNRLAFAKLAELAGAGGQPLPDIVYLQNLRFAVRANPLDFDSALRFAQYAQMLGLYEPASAAYKYCVDLAAYLAVQSAGQDIYPADKLVSDIYRPWLLCCFNIRRYSQCLRILEDIRDKDIFDLQAEAIASQALRLSGDEQGSKVMLDAIGARSDKIISGRLKAFPSQLADFVWFYSFIADADSEKLLAWATKAYDADPNSPDAASLFAYALVLNNQVELADSMLEKIGITTQAAGLARAMVLLRKNGPQDVNSAADLLNRVINTAPGNFESRKAEAKLKELGLQYAPVINSEAFVTALQNDFGQAIFSQFVEPAKMVSMEFDLKGSEFSYGSEIAGNLVIMNNSSEPMVVCPDAMLKGNIRVDAQVGGDLNERIPVLIAKTVRPSYEIKPGDALFIPLRLDTGRVKSILDCHPQAQLTLEYTAYVDPTVSANGEVKNAYAIKPAKAVLTRRRLNLNTRYLQQRLDALKRGHQGQKIKSAQLFAGLLAEQQKFRRRGGAAYRFMYAEPQLLSSALARCLSENDWILKVQTISAMLRLKLDYRLTEAVSEELNNSNWPVRLMSVFILAQNQDPKFKQVLAWTAENDTNPQVRELAAILSGAVTADAGSISPPSD